MRGYYLNKYGSYFAIGKRDCQVSVRIPKEVYDVISSYDGRSFSDKLVNFVVDHSLAKGSDCGRIDL